MSNFNLFKHILSNETDDDIGRLDDDDLQYFGIGSGSLSPEDLLKIRNSKSPNRKTDSDDGLTIHYRDDYPLFN